MPDYILDHLSKYTHEEICEELSQINRNLDWLNEDIALTLKQRTIFNDMTRRVKKLLGTGR